MTKFVRVVVSAAAAVLIATSAQAADQGPQRAVNVDDSTFKCVTDMTPVRHFYVDNLSGNLERTKDQPALDQDDKQALTDLAEAVKTLKTGTAPVKAQ